MPRGIARRLRLVPCAIFLFGVLLSVKIGSIWQGVEVAVSSPTMAEVKAPAAAAPAVAKVEEPAPALSTAGANVPAMTEEEMAVLQKLSARREALDARERELDLRENLLAAAEKRLDAKLAEMKKIQGTVSGLIQKHDEEEEAKLKSLVKMYEIMKPKEAAQIFEKLEMPVLLDVIERMREQKSGPIIAKMDPAKAEKLTAALAERRTLPKTVP
jgi:flagellar motility protein MotE (MotC chaperone)